MESEKNAMKTMIVEDNNIAMSITYQLECAKTRKISKTRPEPRKQGLLGFGLDNPDPKPDPINYKHNHNGVISAMT